jgi:AcrR family transcriptional regulator
MTTRTPATPPRRTDARRNRERLVEAATRVFTAQGVDAPLDTIAREAGVGNATMYRNFPTREAILEAVLRDLHDELGRRAQDLLRGEPPGEAFIRWLAEFLDYTQSLLGLPEPLASATRDESSALYASCEGMRVAATRLLVRAQEAGDLRRDVLADDLFAHVLGIAWVTQYAGDKRAQASRLLAVLADGIREAPQSRRHRVGS